LEKKDKKSYINNFIDVCKSINRDSEEIRSFLGKELRMETSMKENKSLKIDGMVRSVGMIENIIKNYVINHVMCKSCKSCKTNVIKEGRINYLVCTTCNAKMAIDKKDQ